jgi:hypothetical protein
MVIEIDKTTLRNYGKRKTSELTIRDFFAAKAMNYVLNRHTNAPLLNSQAQYFKAVASECYKMADAMIVERYMDTIREKEAENGNTGI